MWLFTKLGFFSVVAKQVGESMQFMIRARRRKHLENLIDNCLAMPWNQEILEGAGTDYEYRIIVSPKTWLAVLETLGANVDYDNFKASTIGGRGTGDRQFQSAIHSVWEVMASTSDLPTAFPTPQQKGS